MYKKANRLQLNKEQEAAVFCGDNAVVAAGAGSGKTMVLASRFAWLLTEKDYKVDEILTLTFTRKAATQMFRRIHSLLSEIAEKEDGIRAQRARAALDDFIHSRIQTLDSYSSSLVKQCANRYGLSPDFTIDQERCHSIALEEALPFLITHRRHPAVERLYSDNRPKDIAGNIFADVLEQHCKIDRPGDFTEDAKTQFSIICAEWKKQSQELAVMLAEVEDLLAKDNELLPLLVPVMEKYKKENVKIPQAAELRDYFDFLLSVPREDCIEKAESHPLQEKIITLIFILSEIKAQNLRKGKKFDNPVKERIKYFKNNFFAKFSSLALSCIQAGFILSIMSLLTELQERYLGRKRAEGVLTFADVASLSRTILLEQEDIRQSEKEAFKAIMIDEFQDNNELQKDLLFLLAEKPEKINKCIPPAHDLCGGKLFFVGDEKQSIYMFRGADVSVFRKLKDEIGSSYLTLKTNYRSAPLLIGAFNAIFGGSKFDSEGKQPPCTLPSVFAPSVTQNSLPLYEASYSPLKAGVEGEGRFTVCILIKGEQSDDMRLSADENEARFTAEKIRRLLDEKDETGNPKYKPKDIAILFRSRTPQYHYEKHLRMLDIPYTCEDINDLFFGGLVNDIMSVLRLTSHPKDSAAYAQMLRSPFAGLSLPGTALCLSIFNETEDGEPFCGGALSRLDEYDQKKYLCGKKIYESICGMAAKSSISALVSELWYKEGYRYETEWNPSTSVYREIYDYLFYLAVKAEKENQGLAAFTDYMCAFRDSGGHLSEVQIPLERPSAVHISSIHKSKGLEYPVVFLCGCGRRGQTDRSDNVYFSNEAGIVISPPLPPVCASIPDMKNNFFWEQTSSETRQKRTAELRRLLYVAMTRAEKELYVTGFLDIRKSDKYNETDKDDFSLTVKNFIENKMGEYETTISGDSIIDNDTLFGLLLPSIVSHIPENGLKTGLKTGMKGGSSFFNLEVIPVYTTEYLRKQGVKNTNLENSQKGLNEFFRRTYNFYQKVEIIQTPVLQDNHITPVSLRGKEGAEEETDISLAGKNLVINREFSGVKANDVFTNVDLMLARFAQTGDDNTEKFNSGSFGTIAHICVEARLNGGEPQIPSNIAGFLTPDEAEALLAAGKELALRFISSPLGKIAEKARLRESEFSFRSLIKNKTGNEIFINGTIDLFFEDADSIHVVDFKTDSKEMPAEHTAQMACYYQAASTLFALPAKKECRAWLYYLRTGHAIEMTDRVKQYDLSHKAF